MNLSKRTLPEWVIAQLAQQDLHISLDNIVPLAGDAGFRRYFRVATQPSFIACLAPPATEKNPQFMALAAYLRAQGVHTPAVIAADLAQGFFLLEDLGDCQLIDELDHNSVEGLYAEAMMVLLCLQQSPLAEYPQYSTPVGAGALTEYDRPTLRQELEIFREWFVGQLLGYSLSDSENLLLDNLFLALEDSALDQPQVLVHRDYHCRNLMVQEGSALGVIDFQDAVAGPFTYDLVSLLRDCYIRWSPQQVKHWALTYADMAVNVGLLDAVCEQTFLRWFDLMGMQRHIKVLGVFARLYLRDGKSGYLNDLPLVMRYTLEVAQQHPECEAFREWFESVLLPIAQQQPWYQDYRLAGEEISG